MTHAAQTLDWQQVSRALFETDPMHTACKENDCFDEYNHVARGVVAEIEGGATPDAALKTVLGDWFGEELLATRDLSPVIKQLNAQSGEGGGR